MKEPEAPVSKQKREIDNSLLAAIDSIARMQSKRDQQEGNLPSLIAGLPVPSLAFRYLIQNTTLPLGMVYHLVGPPASFKSLFGAEIARWHRLCGGAAIICEAETKPTPMLRGSVLDHDFSRIYIRECQHLEQWQKTITDYLKEIRKVIENDPESAVPVAFVIDSYMGKMPLCLLEEVRRRGYAERHFGIAAMLIGDWLSAATSFLQGLPVTIVGINHLKQTTHPITQRPIYRTPGGQFLQHQNVIEIRISRSKTVYKRHEDTEYLETIVQLYTSKNSRGAQDKQIQVPLRQWNEVIDGEVKLFSNFDWWAATTYMLYDGTGMGSQDRTALLPKIKKVVDIQKRSRGDLYWCKSLGVSKDNAISAHEMGVLVEENTELQTELCLALGICKLPVWNEQSLATVKPYYTRSLVVNGEEEDRYSVEMEAIEVLEDDVSLA